MKARIYISAVTILALTLVIYSYKISPTPTFRLTYLDTTSKATKISISKLANSYKNYQGRYIETSGTFYAAFEEFAIYAPNNLFTGESKGFWLSTGKDLNIDLASFEKMNGERITIKGIVDTTDKGHLGSYLATIKGIYFWKQQ